jgi:hypothetical protein
VLFRDHTEGLDLPLITTAKISFSSKVVTANTIKTFIEPDPKDIPSDACRHECMVFRGMQLDPAHRDCRKANTAYENCSPFSGTGHSNRIAMKEVYCRTIIGELI